MDLEWLAGLTVTSTLFRDLESGEAILAAEVEPRFAATEDEELEDAKKKDDEDCAERMVGPRRASIKKWLDRARLNVLLSRPKQRIR